MGASPSPTRHRRERPQVVLRVLERIELSRHLVRIVAGGPGVAELTLGGYTDAYSKMLFAHPDARLTPPYDLDALRSELPPELLPSTRTYTVRRIDHATNTLWVDFVVHGAEGVAGPWADRAVPGDPLVLRGVGGGYAPRADAAWHLLAGDESAIPAIASALEAMPAGARGIAFIEVGAAEDELELAAPPGFALTWLHRGPAPAGTSSVLVDAVREVEWLPGIPQVFVHGERGAMQALRPHFTDDRGLERAELSLSPYWAYGRREDRFQAEKREAVGQI